MFGIIFNNRRGVSFWYKNTTAVQIPVNKMCGEDLEEDNS